MTELVNSINEHYIIYQLIDWLELAMGIFLCVNLGHWKSVTKGAVCLYAGAMTGSFFGFLISYDCIGLLTGAVFGILMVTALVNVCPRGETLILGFLVIVKIVTILLVFLYFSFKYKY